MFVAEGRSQQKKKALEVFQICYFYLFQEFPTIIVRYWVGCFFITVFFGRNWFWNLAWKFFREFVELISMELWYFDVYLRFDLLLLFECVTFNGLIDIILIIEHAITSHFFFLKQLHIRNINRMLFILLFEFHFEYPIKCSN